MTTSEKRPTIVTLERIARSPRAKEWLFAKPCVHIIGDGWYWRPEGAGYTDQRDRAWIVSGQVAWDLTHHCGPEKRIRFEIIPPSVELVTGDPKTCPHENFKANVAVGRIEPTPPAKGMRFCADVRINCTQCGVPFRFLGLPAGLDLNGASVSVDGEEARLAIGTPDTVASIIDGDCPVGFTVRKGA